MAEFDYSDFQNDDDVSEDMLAKIRKLAAQQRDLESLKCDKEAELAEVTAALKRVSEIELPTLMDEVELPLLGLGDGVTVEVGEHIRASLKKGEEETAFAFVIATGNEKMIKRQIVVEFGMGEESWANHFVGDLKKRKKPVNSKIKRTIAPQTLLKFIKDQLATGIEVPQTAFSIFRQRKTSIKVKT